MMDADDSGGICYQEFVNFMNDSCMQDVRMQMMTLKIMNSRFQQQVKDIGHDLKAISAAIFGDDPSCALHAADMATTLAGGDACNSSRSMPPHVDNGGDSVMYAKGSSGSDPCAPMLASAEGLLVAIEAEVGRFRQDCEATAQAALCHLGSGMCGAATSSINGKMHDAHTCGNDQEISLRGLSCSPHGSSPAPPLTTDKGRERETDSCNNSSSSSRNILKSESCTSRRCALRLVDQDKPLLAMASMDKEREVESSQSIKAEQCMARLGSQSRLPLAMASGRIRQPVTPQGGLHHCSHGCSTRPSLASSDVPERQKAKE